jgi:hypothetical protein
LDSDYDVAYAVDRSQAEDILQDAYRFVARVERYFDEESADSHAD